MAEHTEVFFVLSAGRTGTVFLADVLEQHFSSVKVVHEPWPGRYGLILANLRRRFGTSGKFLRFLLKLGLRYRLRRARKLAKSHYIEINPFLCACADLLPQLGYDYKLVHMVREPLSWAQSITMFRASGYRRYLIEFVPFSMPFPMPSPPGWKFLTKSEKAVWRWRFCNEQIAALNQGATNYLLVRYEDVFSDNPESRRNFSEALSAFLKLKMDDEWFDSGRKLNRSPPVRDGGPVRPGFLHEVTGSLACRLGYDVDAG